MKPILVLCIISMLAALMLSAVNLMTRDRIIEAREQAKLEAVQEIFSFPFAKSTSSKEGETEYFEVFDDAGKQLGVGITAITNLGYSGRIDVLVGIDMEGKITGYKVLMHKETPGLGDQITKPSFKKQFLLKTLISFMWKVKKDGGDVDAITAATISSRAITDALQKGLTRFSEKYQK